MVTNLEKNTIKAIKKFCKKINKHPNKISHLYTRAYVLSRLAPSCLLVAKLGNCAKINIFDKDLKQGDWCATAYICFDGHKENIAIKAVN